MQSVTKEKWVTAVYRGMDYPNYLVSTQGRVKSIDRVDRNGRKQKGFMLKPRKRGTRKGQTPYFHVALHTNGRESRVDASIHRLVIESFQGTIEKELQVNHKSGIKSDNSLDNLEVVTHTENIRHGFKTGLIKSPRGTKHGLNKLTEDQVTEIYKKTCNLARKDFVAKKIGREYGVDGRLILSIYRKESWSWLTDQLDEKINELSKIIQHEESKVCQ